VSTRRGGGLTGVWYQSRRGWTRRKIVRWNPAPPFFFTILWNLCWQSPINPLYSRTKQDWTYPFAESGRRFHFAFTALPRSHPSHVKNRRAKGHSPDGLYILLIGEVYGSLFYPYEGEIVKSGGILNYVRRCGYKESPLHRSVVWCSV